MRLCCGNPPVTAYAVTAPFAQGGLIIDVLFFVHFKFVANTPDGVQLPLGRYAFDLFTQAFYMDVNGSGVAEVVKAPDLVQQLVSGEHSVGEGCQMEQQL